MQFTYICLIAKMNLSSIDNIMPKDVLNMPFMISVWIFLYVSYSFPIPNASETTLANMSYILSLTAWAALRSVQNLLGLSEMAFDAPWWVIVLYNPKIIRGE